MWKIVKKEADIKKMSELLDISETMAQVLVNRDINTPRKFNKYINPALDKLEDFTLAKGVSSGIELIKESIANNEKIVIYGDYDADGVTSTVILYKGLKGLGLDVDFYIPNRIEEGYGLNKNAVREIRKIGTDLLIMCDNGITSVEEINLANELGLKTIIIDHHIPGFKEVEGKREDIIPNANSVIDPKQRDCPYPFKEMCAAGLSYRFICTLYEKLEKELIIHDELLIFSAIGTFCDIVSLLDENRIIAKSGMDLINEIGPINIGLEELMKERQILDKHIDEYHIGFIIGPCINAGGRLDSAEKAVKLFLSQKDEAREYAKFLSELNDERKEMTNHAFNMAMEEIENSDMSKEKIYFIFNEEIHESIAGIVAGRIKDRYYHPTIVFTNSNGNSDIVKGSGRSIENYNLYEGLHEHKELFEKFGGHSQAAGLSLSFSNMEKLYILINQNADLKPEDFIKNIYIDEEIELEDITYKLAWELRHLSPCGKDNNQPLFITKNVKIGGIRIIEDKNTIILNLYTQSDREIRALIFGQVDKFYDSIKKFDLYDQDKIKNGIIRNVDLYMDLVYYIKINEFRGETSVQMNVQEFKLL